MQDYLIVKGQIDLIETEKPSRRVQTERMAEAGHNRSRHDLNAVVGIGVFHTRVGNSQHCAIIGIGIVELNLPGGSTLVLHNVLHVLELSRSFISVRHLDKDGVAKIRACVCYWSGTTRVLDRGGPRK